MTSHSPSLQGNSGHPLSSFETMPDWLFYIPVVTYYILLGLRYGDLCLPTAANPRIETGGLCGESKSGILDLAGSVASQWIAPYVTVTTSTKDYERALESMKKKGLTLPAVVKPDIGCNGSGVKLIRTYEELADILAAFPRGVKLVIQKLIPYRHEAGLFYIRHPDRPNGIISSLTYKDIPTLTGNGRDTILSLLRQDPRASLLLDVYTPRLKDRLDEVLPEGQTLDLVFAGNHCKGSIFRNGKDDITPALTRRLDEIMKDIPDFHFGRVDVKFDSVESLREGKNFEIIEINGIGSEATHIWDSKTTLREAYATQFHHYHEAFLIGAKKRKEGWKPCPLFYGFRLWFRQRDLIASYPLND
ncbi:ATP-grasp domain-containing protein [Acetobacter thailandicus]|uniref:ATP-grasp domain-containing protein n=1 Tax=Acetobacter thailandicus TaxID=1502842 RepID=UPI001BA7512C|nr:ATP-grasp domain-containing protein [Acetobacter thailandicus]MBS0959585.1 ATP-grasp domain-containing protein [Acetobacter thailandicus]